MAVIQDNMAYSPKADIPRAEDSRAVLARFCATLGALHRRPEPDLVVIPRIVVP